MIGVFSLLLCECSIDYNYSLVKCTSNKVDYESISIIYSYLEINDNEYVMD